MNHPWRTRKTLHSASARRPAERPRPTERSLAESKERTKQPIELHIGLDASETLYGRVPLKEIRLCVRGIREQGGLPLIFATLGLNPEAIEMISGLSDVHVRLMREHGTVPFYGIKPRTGVYRL